MVSLAGGAFLIGSEDRFAYPADGEGPTREVELSPFWIDRCAVRTGSSPASRTRPAT